MHKTHPSSKKLKDFFKSSIKNESRLYFDCTAVRSRTTFITLGLLSCHIRSPKPHADWSKNAWRVISKKEKLFSEHLFWAVNTRRMCPPTAEYFEKMAGIMNFMYF